MFLWHLQSQQVPQWICLLRIRTTLQFLSSGASQRSSDHPVWMDTSLKSARMEVSPALLLTRCTEHRHVHVRGSDY